MNEGRFPLLALVARQLFSAPCSTADVERLFSAAGRAVNRRRRHLHLSTAESLIYGHANVVRGVVKSSCLIMNPGRSLRKNSRYIGCG